MGIFFNATNVLHVFNSGNSFWLLNSTYKCKWKAQMVKGIYITFNRCILFKSGAKIRRAENPTNWTKVACYQQ